MSAELLFLKFACVVSADKEQRLRRFDILRTIVQVAGTENKPGAFRRTTRIIRRRLAKSRIGGPTPSLWDRQVPQTVACFVLMLF